MKKETYYKKLKALLQNPPEDVKVVYDYMSTAIYVLDKYAEFHDNEYRVMSAVVGSTTPQNGMGYGSDTGNDKDSVIGQGIFVDMQAVQQL